MPQRAASDLFAPRAARLRPSDIRQITLEIQRRALSPLRLDIGEPDLPTPGHIVEAARSAALEPSRYAHAQGTPRFREAAAAFLAHEHGIVVDPADIVATSGATGGLAAVFALLATPGDEVLVPTPGFPSYRTQLSLAGARPVPYPLRSERGWLPDPAEIERLVTPWTKAIVINTPGNPTGAVFDAATLDALAVLAHRHGIAIISDEVYLDLGLDTPAVSAISRDRALTFGVFSLSKSFSMTGWRIGFTVVPPGTAAGLSAVNAQFTASVNSVALATATAALDGVGEAGRSAAAGSAAAAGDASAAGQGSATDVRSPELEHRRALYRSRRDAVHAHLTSLGIPHVPSAGSFYQLLPLPDPRTDSLAAALSMLDHGVAVVPGTAFGEPEGAFLRICLTADSEILTAGVDSLHARFWA